MSWSVIAHTAAGALTSPQTTAINTTGADLIVIAVSQYSGAAAGTIGDSKGNSWSPLTLSSGSISYCKLFYCQSPTVGSGHTFQYSGVGIAAALAVIAVSGSTTSPFDVENGAVTNSGTTLQPGSITPNEANALIITALSDTDNTTGPESVDSSFTITDSLPWSNGNYEGISIAYLAQTSALPVNPTWTWFNSGQSASRIAAFKPAITAVTGTIVVTEGNDTVVATGTVASAGGIVATERNDTAALIGTITGKTTAVRGGAMDIFEPQRLGPPVPEGFRSFVDTRGMAEARAASLEQARREMGLLPPEPAPPIEIGEIPDTIQPPFDQDAFLAEQARLDAERMAAEAERSRVATIEAERLAAEQAARARIIHDDGDVIMLLAAIS